MAKIDRRAFLRRTLGIVGGLPFFPDLAFSEQRPDNSKAKNPVDEPELEYDEREDPFFKWKTISHLIPYTYNFCTEVIDDKIYVIGGNINAEKTEEGKLVHDKTDRFRRFDPLTKEWVKLPRMPTIRDGMSTEAVGSKLFVFGGDNSPDFTYIGGICDIVEMYDSKDNTWTKLKPMPSERKYHASVSLDGKIYLMGGEAEYEVIGTTSSRIRKSKRLFLYNPLEDKWERLADMPFGVKQPAAAALNGEIYVMGGDDTLDYKDKDLKKVCGRLTDSCSYSLIKYNPKEDRWERLADMPMSRVGHSAVVLGDKLFVFGDVHSNMGVIFMYNPREDKWIEFGYMDTRGTNSVVNVKDRLYLFGICLQNAPVPLYEGVLKANKV